MKAWEKARKDGMIPQDWSVNDIYRNMCPMLDTPIYCVDIPGKPYVKEQCSRCWNREVHEKRWEEIKK